MATKRGPRFKECRRLGVNTCGHPKAMKRADAPAFNKRKKVSEYGLQLTEKQKVKAYYGILDKQLRRYYEKARAGDGVTADKLIASLECRLDNIVYRIGFANSIRLGRQMVTHGHVLVNGRRTTYPSYAVKPGDQVELALKSRKNEHWRTNFNERCSFSLPYIIRNQEDYRGELARIPRREEIPVQIDDHMVVEYFSR